MITSDDMVDDEGELVHYAFYADIELVYAAEALKDSKWMKAMNEELKSIEDNNTPGHFSNFLKARRNSI